MSNTVIIDYKMGNLHSVYKKLKALGGNPIIASEPNEILKADKIILPGVGHFSKAMEHLAQLNLMDVLNEKVLIKQTPILGICLGMQLMAKHSCEGNVNGFGWIDGDVKKFTVSDRLMYKIPHMGWNSININKQSSIMKGINDSDEFYFVHAYHWASANYDDVLNTSVYEYEFVSAVEKENIFGVQYHPEKSHDVGELLLKNFIEL